MTAIAAPGRRLLDGKDYKTLALSALGGALEFYDFIIFVFFVTVLGHLFFPPGIPDWVQQVQAFGIFAAGYLARPLGGLLMAHFGDRLGRKRMFTLSILIMALSTLGIAALPTYQTIGIAAPILLLLMRVLQGAAIGGEVPGAWTFVSEHVPAGRIGLACGILTCGLTSGILLGSLIATAINVAFTPDAILAFGWRVPFLLGGVFGLVAVYLRRWLEETPVFKEMQARKQLASELPIKAVLRDHKAATVVSMLLTWLLSGAIVVAILMTPTLVQTLYKVSPRDALTANSIATLFLSFGCVFAGFIVDKVGAGRFFTIGSLFFGVVTYWFYTSVAADPSTLFTHSAVAGFSVGVIGAVPYVLVKAFPAQVRFTGVSFAYNIAYAIFGGLTPLLVTIALKSDPMAHAHYLAFLSLIGAGTGVYLWSRSQH